ncbi:HAMP domain-containing histidine kinase [Flagellatimonas centrodinii]|uniref:sensor histidine kinase n=1 Tax=Flagellatimonas centrodinii TaxID=2806210 RepID=UPI001FEDE556|nr:HAMP domain-containing sensor histidine kinase [Flagellatimonas centrodinii]ULQ46403.1 HAMP domain-containing histidine kinase [Flagellatimonas centrodinii]
MTRHWRKLGATTRLTLLNAVVFGLSALAVIVLVVVLTHRYMRYHLSESLQAELAILVADYHIDGLEGVIGLIRDRENFETEWHRRTYRLEDVDGRQLAGPYPTWPPDLGTSREPVEVAKSEAAEGSTPWLITGTRLPGGERLLVGFDTVEEDALSHEVERAAGWSLLVATLLAFVGSYLVNRAAARQVAIIDQSAQRIMAGDLDHRIPSTGSGDELDQLGETLNQMLDRINELISATRSATDAIAHDLRSPLARLRGALEEAITSPPPDPKRKEWLQDQIAQLDQVLGTFKALLQLATVESGVLRARFTGVSMATVVSDALSLYEAAATERGIRLRYASANADTPITGDRHLLFQAVANLLDNAIKFSPPDRDVSVRLARHGDRLQLDVEDQGPGIPAGDEIRVFDRLFRHDAARQSAGFGLGLSVVRAIARLHHGDCQVIPSRVGAHLRMHVPLRYRNSQR